MEIYKKFYNAINILRFDDSLEIYKKFYNAINILDAKMLVFHGVFSHTKLSFQEISELFSLLRENAEKYGVILAHENVSRCVSKHIDFIKTLRKIDPKAKFVCDIKQCIRSGVDVYEVLNAMGNSMVHIHISDNSELSDCLPLGKGNMNFTALNLYLQSINYKGHIVLELYRTGYDDYSEVFDCIYSHKKMFNYM